MFTLNDLFNPSERNIVNKFAPTIKAINDREYEIQTLSDAQIQERMRSLILRYQREENMTNVLEESFALTREASKRTLGLRHFDTQLMGGLVLNSGKLAEFLR